jgi:CRISPR-associated protein Csx3
MKVVLCGPPHSGKSCLRDGLKQAILPYSRLGQAPYPFILTACPDGEGSWYAETARQDPELAKSLKQNYKRQFTPAFAERVAADVCRLSLPLNIIDIGGKIDDKNRRIVACATHAVIISGDRALIPAWQDFCVEMNLSIIALLYSDYTGTSDRIESETPILKGSVHYLERGVEVSDRPMIQTLARRLVAMSQNGAG